ncbi:MAG: isoprenylcysteine carboxylmethyltransferase family protein, partial [Candidatus Omnitrophica bacterium]|nr:isoprenylcysteine carboxylmethyltransferase family protein [Candidatus Omnitrophota bacterium]
ISQVLGYIAFIIFVISSSAWGDILPFLDSTLFLLGVILVAVAAFGRLWCSLYIGGYKTNILITVGPYSISRNPLYFFNFLGAIGVGFATETFSFPLIVAIIFAIYYPLVIKGEEEGLKKRHNAKFDNYLHRTPCFFPNIFLLNEPDTYIVNPKIFKKDLFYALWFVWALGILELIEELHDWHIIPCLFKIY